VTKTKPPVTGTAHTLPFDKLSPRDFERLCLWLVEREGYERAEHLGATGSEQGRDIVAWREGKLWAFQCKSVQRFGPKDVLAEINKVMGLPDDLRPAALVFLATCDVSARTRQKARERCGEGMECHFWAGTELDAMVKHHPDIVEEFFGGGGDEVIEPAWWKRFRRHPLVFYPKVVYAIVAAIVTLLAGLAGIGADIGGARQQLQQWGVIRAFSPERRGETLIVIASFYYSEELPNTEAHREICRAIQEAKEDLGFSNLRVEVEPTRLRADDLDRAQRLGRRYNASMVIWGADTGVRVTVNYLNLKHPDFEAAQVEISETERTLIPNPSGYAEFVTRDLPGQLTFLSLFAIGQSYYIEGAYADSLEVIQKAVGSVVPGTEPVEGLADAYFRLGWLHQVPIGDDERAIADYDQAIALQPDYALAYYNRGVAYADKGDLDHAIADYDQAIALQPDYAVAYSSRGVAYHHKGDLDHAIANYDQAIALKPDYAEAYYNRGVAYRAKGDLDHAIADYDQAIALKPDYAVAYGNRGVAYRVKGDLAHAIADYDQAITLKPDYAVAYNNRGVAYRDKGDLDHAIADYDQAVALKPDYAEAYNNRGVAYRDKGDLAHAIADYDQAIALTPDYARAYNNRGIAYADKGDLDHAIADYDQAIALKPDYAEAYYNRGVAYADKGDLDHAITDYDQAIALKPDLAEAYVNRGIAYVQAGEKDKAIADFRKVLDLSNDPRWRQQAEEQLQALEAR
jgi:tetratricopeptide (TPR) repeat protein